MVKKARLTLVVRDATHEWLSQAVATKRYSSLSEAIDSLVATEAGPEELKRLELLAIKRQRDELNRRLQEIETESKEGV